MALIPMSSMADIAFLLLIFFIVTTAQEQNLKLPEVQELYEIESEFRVNVTYDANEYLYINNQMIAEENFIDFLAYEYAVNPSREVLFYGHNQLRFGEVWKVLQKIKESGWNQVHLVCEKKLLE